MGVVARVDQIGGANAPTHKYVVHRQFARYLHVVRELLLAVVACEGFVDEAIGTPGLRVIGKCCATRRLALSSGA